MNEYIPECCKQPSKEQLEKYEAKRKRHVEIVKCLMGMYTSFEIIQEIITPEIEKTFIELTHKIRKLEEE